MGLKNTLPESVEEKNWCCHFKKKVSCIAYARIPTRFRFKNLSENVYFDTPYITSREPHLNIQGLPTQIY